MTTPRTILVCHWGALGDMIAGTVAIRALRERYPDARITLLSNQAMTAVCPAGTIIDEVMMYDSGSKGIASHFRLLRELRRRRFDLGLNLRWTSERSAMLLFLSGAARRVGAGPGRMLWTYTVKVPVLARKRHEFLRYLDMAVAAGAEDKVPRPFVHRSNEDDHLAEEFLRREGIGRKAFLALHPGASLPSKAWLPERYAAVARAFVQEGLGPVLLTWGPGEEELAQSICAEAGRGVFVGPRTTVGGLGAILARCNLCVTNYSGAMNVAMAVGAPLIALGCTSKEEWGPLGDLHRTINTARANDSYNDAERRALMDRISVEEVLQLLRVRWGELSRTSKGERIPA